MDNGNIVVTYDHIEEAFDKNPDQFQHAVYDSANKASGGDPIELIAEWNEGLAASVCFAENEKMVERGDSNRNASYVFSKIQKTLAAQYAQNSEIAIF
jgi:hypothetical protein